MKVTSLVRSQIALDMQEAMDKIAKKYGLTPVSVDVRRFRNDLGVRVMKFDLMDTRTAGADPFQAIRKGKKQTGDLDLAMKQFNIKRKTNAKGDTLIEYVPSRPKYPFVYMSARGTRWKASAEQIFQRFC